MSKLDIRRALAEHGITQATLCERTGLRTQNIISLINGNPTVLKLQQVAEGRGCDITDLFYSEEGTSNMSKHDIGDETTIENKESAITCPYCSKRFILLDK